MTLKVQSQPLRWLAVGRILRTHPRGTVLRFSPSRVEHPRDAGMMLAITFPVGQRADYRLDIGEGQDLVVSEFAHGFEAHLDQRPVFIDFEAAFRDAPGSSVVGLIAAGALVGVALGRSQESAIAGAMIGGIAALAGIGVANAQSAPQVADAAARMLTAMTTTSATSRAIPNACRTRPGRHGADRLEKKGQSFPLPRRETPQRIGKRK